MSTNKIEINGMPGLEILEDNAAQNCGGGAFRYIETTPGGNTSISNVSGETLVAGLGFARAFKVENTGGSNTFDLLYANTSGQVIASETVQSGQNTSLYAGGGRLSDGRDVDRVQITQV